MSRMVEASLPYDYIHVESVESEPIERRLSACIKELFPATKGTPVPKLTEKALDVVAQFVDTHDAHPLILRGSTVPRIINGTPLHYGAPGQLEYHLNRLESSPSELTKSAVRKLSKGPDMDWMYIKRPGVTDDDIHQALCTWADEINSRPNMASYHIDVLRVPLSDWNGENDTRVYSVVMFRDQKGKKTLLTIDIGQFPIDKDQEYDVRWSGYMTVRDMAATADLAKKSKRHNAPWYVSIHKELVSGWRHGIDRNYFPGGNDAQTMLSFLRSIVYKSVWPTYTKVKIGDDFFYVPENFAEFISNRANHTTFYFNWDNFEHIGEGDLTLLEKRHEEIIAQALLGLTLLGPEWLVVANEVGYLKHTQLGQIIRGTDLMDKLIEKAWSRQNHPTEPDRQYIFEQLLRVTQNEIQKWFMENIHQNADEDLKDTVSQAVLQKFSIIFPYFSSIGRLPVKYRLGSALTTITHDYQRQLGYTALWPGKIDLYPVSLAYDLHDLGVIEEYSLSALVEVIDPLPTIRKRIEDTRAEEENIFDNQKSF